MITNLKELEVKLDELCSLFSSYLPILEKSQMKSTWFVLLEIYEFRSEQNHKAIELAKLGANLRFNDEGGLNRFVEVGTELETIKTPLPYI